MPLRLVIGLLAAFVIVGCNNSSSSSPRPTNNPGVVNPTVNPNAPIVPASAPVVVTPDGEMVPATPAVDYEGSDLNPETALSQYGTWEQIGEDRYFVPGGVAQDWQPYQNGQWTYDEELGWSFASADKWGWLTEHYGIWRHHRNRWVWLPFPDRHYEPSVVTWFNEGEYVGWYPYSNDPRFSAFYLRGGVALGFTDGFWAGGYLPVFNLAFGTRGFVMGIVMVNRVDVTRGNLLRYLRTDRNLINRIARNAFTADRVRQGFVGPHPGGDRAKSFDFIRKYASVKPLVGRSHEITARGGAKIRQPYMAVNAHMERGGRAADQRPDRGGNRTNQPAQSIQPRNSSPSQSGNPRGQRQRDAAPVAPAAPAAATPERAATPQVSAPATPRQSNTRTFTVPQGQRVVVRGDEGYQRVEVRTDDKGQQQVKVTTQDQPQAQAGQPGQNGGQRGQDGKPGSVSINVDNNKQPFQFQRVNRQ